MEKMMPLDLCLVTKSIRSPCMPNINHDAGRDDSALCRISETS